MNTPKEYYNLFGSWGDICYNFAEDYDKSLDLPEPKYVYADYDCADYEGYAVVITSWDGETFGVVEGSHCSCYGLEDQWEPTIHSLEELQRMFSENNCYYGINTAQIRGWLKQFE